VDQKGKTHIMCERRYSLLTANQIAYAKVREEERANRSKEMLQTYANELTAQSNMIKSYDSETQRMNAETQRLQAMNTAQQNTLRQQELQQNYILATAQQAETQRHNTAQEYESQRHNVAAETEAATQRETSQQIEGTKVRAGVLSGLINVAGNLIGKFFH
jgi:predicted  nucleic acid-binding Zn-ribbon protein